MKIPTPTATATVSPAPESPAPQPKRRRIPPLSLAALRQFLNVAKPYWLGDERWRAWGLLLLLIVLMLVDTQVAVMLNNQTGEMTSALAGKDGGRFWNSVRTCLLILAFSVTAYAVYL